MIRKAIFFLVCAAAAMLAIPTTRRLITHELKTLADSTQSRTSRGNRESSHGDDLPKRLLIGYWQSLTDNAVKLPLRNVPAQYDVVNVGFGAPARGTAASITFTLDPEVESPSQFADDVRALHRRGKKVVLSIGGEGSTVYLRTAAEKRSFTESVQALVKQYNFDGIDIDFEESSLRLSDGDDDFAHPTTPSALNLISALHDLKRIFGRSFIISFAPETAALQSGYAKYAGTLGCYIPVIEGTRDILTYVQTQDYNSGSMFGPDHHPYAGGTADFHVAMTEFLLHGFPVGGNPDHFFKPLEPRQVVFGVPASPRAASSSPPSFTTFRDVMNAFNYLSTGRAYEGHSYPLAQPAGYPGLRGVMIFSINWDAAAKFSMSTQLARELHSANP